MSENIIHPEIDQELIAYIKVKAESARIVKHMTSKTSEESMRARLEASGESVTGAKALLIKMDVRDVQGVFAVIVLPGFKKLDSKRLKHELKNRIEGLRNFRFASPEEMAGQARGVEPGRMPPFGRPIFPAVAYTFIDKALLDHQRIGFNAAHFERSVIMDTVDYIEIVTHDGIFDCSTGENA